MAITTVAAVSAVVAGCSAEPAGQDARSEGTLEPTSAPTAGARQDGPPGVLPRKGEVGRIAAGAGLPPVISSIPTRRKVVFLTIDDGWEQDPGFVAKVRSQRIPITTFAMRDAVEATGTPDTSGGAGRYVGAGKWGYFRTLRDAGVAIENHTLSHPNLRTMGFDAQKREICRASALIRKEIGARPTLFRPPFGNYNTDTLRAAKSCGIEAVLLWTATVQPGGKIAYQVPDKRLRPGDILLLHFRPNLARDFQILVDKIKRRGYELGNLEAYLTAARVRQAG
ncbi:polysaccharide deacetylase family protein [Nonomuraea sp. NPDC046570]|uniref:polysaccharide deacetylase family protein n=1 Tax=Nonomuraea sp. NPDC046570 TaxID=3155255 RepID=UPI00340E41A4